MTGLARDLVHALRIIRKSPLFCVYVVAPLALGIGLNGAIFILLDALLLRPLPVAKPDELVRLVQVIQNLGPRSDYAYDALEALERKSTSFSAVIGYADQNAALRDSSGVSRVRCQIVTGNYFAALGVQPLYGRYLTSTDALASVASPPVVLSYAYWRRYLDGDPSLVGRAIMLDDHSFTVVGIMPRYFNGLDVETTPDIRAPLIAASLFSSEDRAQSYRKLEYTIAARLKPGVTLDQARVESGNIVRSVAPDATSQLRNEHLEVEPASRGVSILRGKFAAGLVLLMGGVGLLLLMICANVGGLLLARLSNRREEMAVRLALGATFPALIRQCLIESLVLTAIGGAAGMALAVAATPLMARAMPQVRDLGATILTLSLDLRPDTRVVSFAVLLSILCALLAGIPAAISTVRANLQTSLKTARSTARQPLRWILVAIQIGLCTFLLLGAGLLTSTFRHLRALDPGFDRDHVVTFTIDPGMAHYTAQQSADLQARLVANVSELPGVRSAGISVIGVMHGTGIKTTVAPEGQIAHRSDFLNTSLNIISPGYFETMGIPLLEGRNIRADEPQTKPRHVVVNRAFVRRFYPDRDPLGQKFGTGTEKMAPGEYEIIGVVGDAKYRSLREPVPPTMYYPPRSDVTDFTPFILHVRTEGRPEALMPEIRRAMNAIDPQLPFLEIRTLAEEVDATLWAERLLAWLSSLFAAAAAILAILGVYATLAYAISQTRREIGIRVALGAQRSDIIRVFSMRPLIVAALGVFCGLAAFYIASPAFRGILYDISPADPLTAVLAASSVLLVALFATMAAVNGALRVDPSVVLRDE